MRSTYRYSPSLYSRISASISARKRDGTRVAAGSAGGAFSGTETAASSGEQVAPPLSSCCCNDGSWWCTPTPADWLLSESEALDGDFLSASADGSGKEGERAEELPRGTGDDERFRRKISDVEMSRYLARASSVEKGNDVEPPSAGFRGRYGKRQSMS